MSLQGAVYGEDFVFEGSTRARRSSATMEVGRIGRRRVRGGGPGLPVDTPGVSAHQGEMSQDNGLGRCAWPHRSPSAVGDTRPSLARSVYGPPSVGGSGTRFVVTLTALR